MSAYNLNLIQPSNISPFATKPPSRATTPKKYTLDNFTTPSDLPKHTPDRPNLQNYSPHRFRDAASKFQPRTENPPSQHDNSRLYNSNHIPAPRFNPEVGPSIRVLPEPAHLPPTQHKLTGLKPRKGSDNNIGLSNKLTVNIEAKEGFQVVMT